MCKFPCFRPSTSSHVLFVFSVGVLFVFSAMVPGVTGADAASSKLRPGELAIAGSVRMCLFFFCYLNSASRGLVLYQLKVAGNLLLAVRFLIYNAGHRGAFTCLKGCNRHCIGPTHRPVHLSLVLTAQEARQPGQHSRLAWIRVSTRKSWLCCHQLPLLPHHVEMISWHISASARGMGRSPGP